MGFNPYTADYLLIKYVKIRAMKTIKSIIGFLCFILLTSFNKPIFSDEYDIEAFYKGITPSSGTMILTSREELEEAALILVPIDLDKGKYVVNVTRKGSDLYKIDDKNIYIKTKYCHEYSRGQEVALNVESSYGYTKGKIIF